MNIEDRISKIIQKTHQLEKACYPEYKFNITYLTIFSQSKKDFRETRSKLAKLGKETKANNGYKYKLNNTIKDSGEEIDLIRLRKPDLHRKELGCADLAFKEEDYARLRDKALNDGYDVILRKGYEMIELSDFHINVYAYLVKDL